MMRKILPVLLALVGLGGGVGAGMVLRPHADGTSVEPAHGDATGVDADHTEETTEAASDHAAEGETLPEFVKLNNQFVIPVVEGGRVVAMVILALSLEVGTGTSDAVYSREPKVRDAFLQVLFDHANVGGFNGSFTDGSNLIVLRRSLKEAAVLVLGDVVKDVLITDIARQDN